MDSNNQNTGNNADAKNKEELEKTLATLLDLFPNTVKLEEEDNDDSHKSAAKENEDHDKETGVAKKKKSKNPAIQLTDPFGPNGEYLDGDDLNNSPRRPSEENPLNQSPVPSPPPFGPWVFPNLINNGRFEDVHPVPCASQIPEPDQSGVRGSSNNNNDSLSSPIAPGSHIIREILANRLAPPPPLAGAVTVEPPDSDDEGPPLSSGSSTPPWHNPSNLSDEDHQNLIRAHMEAQHRAILRESYYRRYRASKHPGSESRFDL
ncbi:uncharacterized protein PV06_08686 [Exophiala oligosperma]|uniref:Uncharacterized protein n=1 Tax=Exophiala oligosperma TaxID=215243 RepID=A0A0D2AF88_9EURO|nr:uncharacterized protein PV06_08686 [Exophiala oligosperma]KIW38856.1 hypothetical protein PV06_08686 [Exophiala oligosperma]